MKNIYLILLTFFITGANAQTVGLFNRDAGSIDGYVLFSPISSTNTYLIDKCGYLIHSWSSAYQPGQAVYFLEDGTLLRTGNKNNNTFNAGGKGGIIEKFDWNSNVIWSYSISSTTECQHHDIKHLPNGNILVLAWELKSNADVIAAGRNPGNLGTAFWSEKIIELQPTGTNGATIVWEWRVWDHLIQDFDSTKANYGIVAQHPELINLNYFTGTGTNADWLHCNAVDYNPHLDQIIISSHNFSEFWIIDHSTTTVEAATHSGGIHGKGGDLLYRWGNPAVYDRGTNADKKLFGQHTVHWIPDGLKDAGNIMIFNNGIQRPAGNFSTVEIIAPPVTMAGDYTISGNLAFQPDSAYWKYQAATPTNFYAMNISGAHRLPNGNTLICEGTKGNFFEIDSALNTVWKYVSPIGMGGNIITQGTTPTQNLVFRCTQYEASYPGFNGLVLSPGNPIEINPLNYVCNMITDLPQVNNSMKGIRIRNVHSDQLSITSSTNLFLKDASVFNLEGKLLCKVENIYVEKDKETQLTFNTTLSPGIYFLSLNSINNNFTGRFLMEE